MEGSDLRSYDMRWFAILFVISFAAIPVPALEVRGAVAGTVGGINNLDNPDYYCFTWNPQNFAGFYYDVKKDIGTERLITTLTEGNKLSGDAPYGVIYQTTAQAKDYEFWDWGSYRVIGFLAEKYFAGYLNTIYTDIDQKEYDQIFFKESADENSLSEEQLEKILLDSKNETIVKPTTPLKLEEGYELAIKYIDNNGMYLELTKNGEIVDSKVISPSKAAATEADKTYYYARNVGNQKNLVIIGVHFKNALRIENQTVATVDGLWQLSDTPTEVKADTQFDKMTIRTVDATNGVITMDNKDYAITLSKDSDYALMPGIRIRTANNDTLRFYIYSEETCECG